METSLRVEPTREEDMPRCVQLINAAFDFVPIVLVVHGEDTPENHIRAGKAHFEMQRDHMSRFPSSPVCIKCVQTTSPAPPTPNDGSGSGTEAPAGDKIVGYAQWYIFDRAQSEAELDTPSYYESFAWVPDAADRQTCQAFLAGSRALRRRLLGGAAYGQVRFLAVEAAHQQKGVSSRIVRWGMDRCAALGIPAYLESSIPGVRMYERMGFAKLAVPEGEAAAHYVPMIWYPPTART